jgi:hypothetical protein
VLCRGLTLRSWLFTFWVHLISLLTLVAIWINDGLKVVRIAKVDPKALGDGDMGMPTLINFWWASTICLGIWFVFSTGLLIYLNKAFSTLLDENKKIFHKQLTLGLLLIIATVSIGITVWFKCKTSGVHA